MERRRVPDCFFDTFNFGIVDFGGMLTVLRRCLRPSVPRCLSIHVDMAAELDLASSVMTTPFSRAIFSAKGICAGVAGLRPGFAAVSSLLDFLGACWTRNARQIDPDFV